MGSLAQCSLGSARSGSNTKRGPPRSFASLPPSKRHLADKYWKQRSNLLLPTHLRLNTARAVAVTLSEPTVGSLWTSCLPADPAITKALCLYMNSTVGLLALLGTRDNRISSYPSFSLDTLRALRGPDFTQLDTDEQDLLDGWFDWLKGQPLLPLPQMH